MAKRAVLAFSGGLDSSAILTWMVKEQGWEVVTFTANVGQRASDSLDAAAAKSRELGAVAHESVDLRRELLEEFFLPALQLHARLEGRYLLGTSLARYPTARAAMRVARKHGCTVLSHGATGKGNDQVRFETTWLVLNADPRLQIEGLEIFSPWKDPVFLDQFGNGGRLVMRRYLQSMGVEIASGGNQGEDPYSQDENVLHISSEGVALERPEDSHVGKVVYTKLTDPEQAPETPEYVRVFFEAGVPRKLQVEDADGKVTRKPVEGDLIQIVAAANDVAGRHGVGLLDMVETRYVGIKSRGVYEAPGHALLLEAHQDLESVVLDGPMIDEKLAAAPGLARQIYVGGWWSQQMRKALAGLREEQEQVNGWALVRVYKGSALAVGRHSPNSLYDPQLSSFESMTGTALDPQKARGFIDVQALHYWAAERARHQARKPALRQ
jgi:argininosuccinate synthase